MDSGPTPRTLARQPRQQRAQDRFERILVAARELLREQGLAGFSIPELAERLEYPRATVYKFFPTPYAVLNELLKRDLHALEEQLYRRVRRLVGKPWQDTVRAYVGAAARFYDANPVARLLILGGPATSEGHRALEMTIQHLGGLARGLMVAAGAKLPPRIDIAALAIEIGTAAFRLSYFLHGEITREYRAEAADAMIAYLARYAPDS